MAIDFPNSPTSGQIFTSGDKSWIWDGTVWKAYGASLSPTVLKVDSTNTRVGINNQSPAYTLDVTGTAQATQFIQGTDYLSPYQGFRNKIINGGFDIWQRGGTAGYTPTANEIQGADRWVHWWNGTGGTRTISRSTFALGQTAVPDNPKYHMTINTSVLGTSQSVMDFWQKIEGVHTFAGQTATLSFWWKSTSSATQASPFVTQNFGTGGSPSSAVDTYLTAQSLASANTWTKYSVSVSIPSISGKTLGTSSNDFLMVGLRFLISATCTIDVANVQFERGSVATPFEQRPIQTELALCQRYYWFIAPPSSGYGKPASGLVANATTVQACGPIWHPVTMRSAPTVGFTFSSNNITAYDGAEMNATAFADASPWTTTNLTTFNLTTASGLTANRTAHILHRVGNITFSSEF